MICPKCGGSAFAKHGFVDGTQRWRCRGCSRNVTERTFSVTYRRRHKMDQIRVAVALMMLTNISCRAAKKILSSLTGSSPSSVTLWHWMREFRDKLQVTSRFFREIRAEQVWYVDEVFIKAKSGGTGISYLVIIRDRRGRIAAVEAGRRREARLIRKALDRAAGVKARAV